MMPHYEALYYFTDNPSVGYMQYFLPTSSAASSGICDRSRWLSVSYFFLILYVISDHQNTRQLLMIQEHDLSSEMNSQIKPLRLTKETVPQVYFFGFQGVALFKMLLLINTQMAASFSFSFFSSHAISFFCGAICNYTRKSHNRWLISSPESTLLKVERDFHKAFRIHKNYSNPHPYTVSTHFILRDC